MIGANANVTLSDFDCNQKIESFFTNKITLEKILIEEHLNLPFSFHLNDPLRPPLIGKRVPNQGLLISLKKLKSGEIKYQNLGKVTSSYRFKSLPEYQVRYFPLFIQ